MDYSTQSVVRLKENQFFDFFKRFRFRFSFRFFVFVNFLILNEYSKSQNRVL